MIINQKEKVFVIAIGMLTPIIGMLLAILVNGVGLGEIYLPETNWNDELFYYKQIEGIINYGHPLGNWGFNESSSLYGNFAAWNPTILIPFIVFGKLFGWGYNSPILYNFIFWEIAFIVNVLIYKPSVKKQIVMSVLYLGCYSNLRYIFSCMAESIITVLLLISCVMLISSYKKWRCLDLSISVLLLGVLTMMRGYYAIFLLPIATICVENKKYKQLLVYSITLIVSMGTFLIINKYLTAPYLTPIFDVSIIEHPTAVVEKLILGGAETWLLIKQALLVNNIKGYYYIIYFLLGLIIIYCLVKEKKYIDFAILIVWFVLLSCMWVLYTPNEGARHLFPIAFVGLFFYMNKFSRKLILVVVVLIVAVLSWCSEDKDFFSIPIIQKQESEYENMRYSYEEIFDIGRDDWDNTILWVYPDSFNNLYYLPSGYAVNCCTIDWLIENVERVKSKYIMVEINALSENEVKRIYTDVVYENNEVRIYKTR